MKVDYELLDAENLRLPDYTLDHPARIESSENLSHDYRQLTDRTFTIAGIRRTVHWRDCSRLQLSQLP